MSAVGEAALSAFFGVLFSKFDSPELLKFAREKQVHGEIKKWEKMLQSIRAVLDDAEEKQMRNGPVKIWLAELQDLAYDLDDLLDEFATEVSRQRLIQEHRTGAGKVHKLVPALCFSPGAVIFNSKMLSKIKEITARLQELFTQKLNLELRETVGGRAKGVKERLPTTSLVNEVHVYGRENDKKAIFELLLRNDGSDDGVSVIPIIGMGGIGKTTLTQLVYNDNNINDYFDLKAWVCVSEDFDVVKVTKTILQSITSEPCDVNDLNLLQVKLKEKLFKKKFLLVLDDVWNENYNDWTILRSPFEVGARESKIIVTTRSHLVSSVMGTIPGYSLQELSNDDCLSVFTQHALGARDFSGHPKLKEFGEEIVRKCNGLPLAAKTIGGILRTSMDPDAWKDVLKSKIWDMPVENSGIIPALWLSYYHLPPHLKQCFAYCAILPKGYEFGEKDIVLLWMAEGFLQQAADKTQIEDLGGKYFRDLVSRSLFQISSRDRSQFVMHDLINDLAQSVAEEICCRVEGDKKLKFSQRVRHSSYVGELFDGVKKFESFHEMKHLRTFLPLRLASYGPRPYLTTIVLTELLPKLRYLRVLSLRRYYITKLLDSIGHLRHVRYLNFSHTSIKCLPDSISTLSNLETLILCWCINLEKLPSGMGMLINLRHLDTTGAASLKGMPVGIGGLTYLRTLSNFVVSHGNGYQIREMKNLSNLKGRLSISGLENVVEVRDALEAKLHEKSGLNWLELKWSMEFANSLRSESVERDILNWLQPNEELKELAIKYYGVTIFPAWVGDPSFKYLLSLNLEYCKYCRLLPSLGKLPLLRNLCIRGMSSIKSVGIELFGENCLNGFMSLETLCYEDMPAWKEWNPCEVDEQIEKFPFLRELSIVECPKILGRLPKHLPSLEKLMVRECKQLEVSISSLPKLHELEIDGCKEVVLKSSADLRSLNIVSISRVSKFTGLMPMLTTVENLMINGCNELTSLWQNEVGLLGHWRSLHSLEILSCPRLISLEAEEEGELMQFRPFCNIKSLIIGYCESLEKLPNAFHNLTSLRELQIENCSKLISFSDTRLPFTLKKLVISNHNNLQYLLDGEIINTQDSLLEHLEIASCPSLMSLSSRCELPINLQHLKISDCSKLASLSSSGKLPTGLKHLTVRNCPELESIAQEFHNNTSLEFIRISWCKRIAYFPRLDKLNYLQAIVTEYCPSLISFGTGGLPTINLKVLRIYKCEELRGLPNYIHNLTSLQELEISNCPHIISFPEEGLPTSLITLRVSNFKLCRPLFEWGLHRLTSLKVLSIKGGCPDVLSFPQEEMGMMLPTTLTSLTIEDFPNLKSLSSKGFQILNSLEFLWIAICPKLTSLPRTNLLLSLLQLHIDDCPRLKQRCRKDKGQEWSKIAHVPRVEIDGRLIHDLEEQS
ncbi:PREDICTED: putative disease resistance RPP13-like protein 1 [Theobroma cacao]|uniref:Disease resistance RPP13-like protein 1 n=1 Tax=Theobroma cacao TaxID=3641 RepID=A0AB32WY60_THECC|nr:PREDICTED: putative disease resistance RPP13-like protein 1 [Theobroma cacao]